MADFSLPKDSYFLGFDSSTHGSGSESVNKRSSYSSPKKGRVLKIVVFVHGFQDGYVPYHSARIDMCQAASWDLSKKGKVFLEMLNDCLDQIRAPHSENRVFMRCDINFDTSSYGKNLNTFIGRAAHIEFLESNTFARFIMWSFPDLFR
ncbi:hypothetical protein CerSpe_058240 [Prunus speciosa]